jgi:hypothetical protein
VSAASGKVASLAPAASRSIVRHRRATYHVVQKDLNRPNLEESEDILWNTMDTPSLGA